MPSIVVELVLVQRLIFLENYVMLARVPIKLHFVHDSGVIDGGNHSLVHVNQGARC